ncbi:minor tail protein [Exiguobacterium phage phiExGM16]
MTDGVLSGGLSYRIKFTARANRTLSLIPSLRPDATKTADRTDAAAISVGTVEKRFSITLKMAGTPGDLAGLALVETVSPVGAILDVTDVTWELSTSSGTDYFDGDSMPNGFVTRTRWLGTPNASRSVLEVRGTEHIRRARSVTFRRGAARSALGLKTDVGILSFELIDSQDPMRGGVFQPGDEIVCISLDRDENMSQLFTGRVTDVAGTYPLNKATGTMRAITTVTVADAVKVHGETPRYGVSIPAGFETYEARISRLSSSALAPVEAPTEGTPREVYVF